MLSCLSLHCPTCTRNVFRINCWVISSPSTRLMKVTLVFVTTTTTATPPSQARLLTPVLTALTAATVRPHSRQARRLCWRLLRWPVWPWCESKTSCRRFCAYTLNKEDIRRLSLNQCTCWCVYSINLNAR